MKQYHYEDPDDGEPDVRRFELPWDTVRGVHDCDVLGTCPRVPRKNDGKVLSAVSAAENYYYDDPNSVSYRPVGFRKSRPVQHLKDIVGNRLNPTHEEESVMNNKSLHKHRMKHTLGTTRKLNLGGNHSELYKNKNYGAERFFWAQREPNRNRKPKKNNNTKKNK